MLVISVVAHVDHGKTTLLDNILSFTRTISPISAGTLRYLDSRIDEQERGITLKLSFFQAENYIFIDTPGHIDFESLIECSSFLCDSFIFIVDVNEGITPRTLSLLNWMKNKNCILVLNKIDKMVNKEVYMVTSQIIESMNVFLEEEYFVWEKNNIIISSSLSLYGLNFDKFKILKENNTLKDALAFIFLLSDDTEEIKREKLLKLLKSKNIHTTEIKKIFPLSHTLLNSLKAIELGFVRNIDNERKKIVKLFQEDFISQKRDYEPQLEDLTSQLEDLESQKKEHEPQLKDLKPQLEDLESKTEDHDNERFKNVITKDLQNERIIDDLTQTVKNKLKLSKVSDDSDLSLRENSSEIGKTSLDAISDFEKNNNTTKIENLTHLYRYFALDQQVKHIQVRSEHNNLKNSHSSVDLLGISPYAIRLQGKKFSIVKLFSKMSEGEQVFCVNDLDGREAVIDKIYIFNNDTLKRTNSVTAGSLIAVESNLLRNCAIFKNFTPTRLSIFKTRPFYIESIRSNDTIIQKIKDLSYFEPILRAKVNKFNNIELFCEGKMHFEKIACDLNNDFVNVPNTNYLLEGASQTKKSVFEKDKIVCEIEMKPLETIENEIKITLENISSKTFTELEGENKITLENISSKTFTELEGKNKITLENISSKTFTELEGENKITLENISSKTFTELDGKNFKNDNINRSQDPIEESLRSEIENALNIFAKRGGTLFHEKVAFTSIHVKVSGTTDENLLYFFSKALKKTYNDTKPIPILLYYKIQLSIIEDLLGKCYKLLSRYKYKLIDEDFDERNKIFEVNFYIQRNLFNQFHDELKKVSKGLFSIKTEEMGFLRYENEDWTEFIETEQKIRGLIDDEIVIVDPEKQRTQKK